LQFTNAVTTRATNAYLPFQGTPIVVVALAEQADGVEFVDGTLLGAKLSFEPFRVTNGAHTLVANLEDAKAGDDTAVVNTTAGTAMVTFAPGTFDLRIATDADATADAWRLHTGQVTQLTWSNAGDLVGGDAPTLHFDAVVNCGQACTVPQVSWDTKGSISSGDLAFTVPTPSSPFQGAAGPATVTVGSEIQQALHCEGADGCIISLAHLAVHRAIIVD
jgi:hypothetical protein